MMLKFVYSTVTHLFRTYIIFFENPYAVVESMNSCNALVNHGSEMTFHMWPSIPRLTWSPVETVYCGFTSQLGKTERWSEIVKIVTM